MKRRIHTISLTTALLSVIGSKAWASAEEAAHGGDSGLLSSLGIDPKLILLQLLAFVLLLLLLRSSCGDRC